MNLGSKQENKEQAVEVAGALGKTAIAAIGTLAIGPAGGIMATAAAELLSVVIPNFRRERYEKFVEQLEHKVSELEPELQEKVPEIAQTPEFADLFEDAARQSVRALSDERIEQIATLLKNGLIPSEVGFASRKRLLEILGQLNDVEILFLQGHALHGEEGREFYLKHQDIYARSAFIGASPEIMNADAMRKNYQNHMEALGLIDLKPNGNFAPTVDITWVGRMLLREIGGHDPFDPKHRQKQ